MSVPKCKECKLLIEVPRFNVWTKDKNYCRGTIITDTDGYQVGSERFIYVRELCTSPKWCPKRIKIAGESVT